MKKVLLLLLCLSLVFCFAACDKTDDTGTEAPEPATATDVEEAEEYVPDPSVTAENEVYITDYAEAASRLGVPALNFPADFEIFRVLLVDEDKVQVEFTCNEASYLGQYVVGMQENVSGLAGTFEKSEDAQLAGWNMKMEYTPESEEDAESLSEPTKKLALAEGYDSASNITAWLVCQNFTDTASFKPVIESFLGCLASSAPAAEDAAEAEAE